MELKFILDFDGVLFNSAFEAYSVCERLTNGHSDFRQDVDFEEFLDFRSVVIDAWQYHLLYRPAGRLSHFSRLPKIKPETQDWEFAEGFFATRAEMMADPDWPKIMSPYDFFFLLRPLLLKFPARFAILSTRNVESIRRTLQFFGADVVPIFGQEDIRRLGSKLEIAREQGWLEPGRYMTVYIDDMNAHLEPFDGKVHLPLHADWGYDKTEADSLSEHQVMSIVGSLLNLAGQSDAA